MITPRFVFLAGLFPAVLMTPEGFASKLVINSSQSNPAPRLAWTELVNRFETENPDIEVEFNTYDHESYKTALRNWLTSEPPDVVQWNAGERLNTFVERGLLEDLSDLWTQENLHENFASTRSAVTIDDRQYAVPFAYYQWAIYYRKDLFAAHDLAEPKTWDEFLHVCATLKQADIIPIAIGTKDLWPAAGWFDYLDLRINGLDFHRELMAGKVAYTDDRVRAVFERWRELIDGGFFTPHHTSYSWQEALPSLVQGRAAMYFIGNFIVPALPQSDLANYDFFAFPVVNPDLPAFEEAPLDVVAIPARAKNKEGARRFLEFVARPDVQSTLNKAVNNIPPNRQAEPRSDRFLQKSATILAEAAGVAQFYDRDTKPEMARVGMKGFQEFMDRPDRLDNILDRLERTRKRVYR